MVILLHANNHEIPVEEFVAMWKVWIDTFHEGKNFSEFCMPRRHATQSLHVSLDQGLAPCLDVMCRILAPEAYQNGMQASGLFMEENSRWLVACTAESPAGTEVEGAKLTVQALARFHSAQPTFIEELIAAATEKSKTITAI